jgi:voltage-gated potassium channel
MEVLEFLHTRVQGLGMARRSAERSEVGRNPRELQTLVVALIRRGKVLPLGGEQVVTIETGDMLIYIRDEEASVAGVAV